eukprot:TRINITY_DN24666_c0_g1_i1.p1 TRINITY_DN24666_c0_g1~~TRINITY_DN24666_c0_g1_i1.p1  ORF type:complete len:299 (+),score=73.58 TRINITY_DN24666_c0_g1_i1:73-897(+)
MHARRTGSESPTKAEQGGSPPAGRRTALSPVGLLAVAAGLMVLGAPAVLMHTAGITGAESANAELEAEQGAEAARLLALCVDGAVECSDWARNGQCSRSLAVASRCPRICGRCKSGLAAEASSSTGETFSAGTLRQGVVAWEDRGYTLSSIPPFLSGAILLRGPHKDLKQGAVITVTLSRPAAICVIVERMASPSPRDGGFMESLPAAGWLHYDDSPQSDHTGCARSCMSLWCTRAPRGPTRLPATTTKRTVMALAVPTGELPNRSAADPPGAS